MTEAFQGHHPVPSECPKGLTWYDEGGLGQDKRGRDPVGGRVGHKSRPPPAHVDGHGQKRHADHPTLVVEEGLVGDADIIVELLLRVSRDGLVLQLGDRHDLSFELGTLVVLGGLAGGKCALG